jgi:hypothetical protein
MGQTLGACLDPNTWLFFSLKPTVWANYDHSQSSKSDFGRATLENHHSNDVAMIIIYEEPFCRSKNFDVF